VTRSYTRPVPHDIALKAMNTAHRLLLKLSGGRVGWDAMGMPVLELTTIGRRSGEPRSVMLTAPLREGESFVVVASRGGDDHHPAWFLNLRDEPRVEVAVQGGARAPMIARVATADERARMWPQIVGKYSNYAGYQKRTDREIPLVLLEQPA
jgi:deazaflavin-dependent oxidoreductase (nitroreductase family)